MSPAASPRSLLRVYGQCDGKHSIADIGRTTGLLEFEVTRAVFQLINAGLVTAASPRPQGTQSIVTVFNRALAIIHATCANVDKVADLREGLSRFATNGWVYDPLFLDAGPLADGTLRPDRVAQNLASLGGDDPDVWLVQLLHEYVGFAMFQAETLLPREVERDLRASVAELLKPLRPIEPPEQDVDAARVDPVGGRRLRHGRPASAVTATNGRAREVGSARCPAPPAAARFRTGRLPLRPTR